MAKKKLESIFKEWDEVDEAMKEIITIDRRVQNIEADMNQTINMVKEKATGAAGPILERKKFLEENIQSFTEIHIDEFKEQKSKKFTFGEVGFRKSTSIITRNVKAIMEAMKQHKMLDCINVSESINKEELAKYDDDSLSKVGAKRKVEDKFFYKPSVERIEN